MHLGCDPMVEGASSQTKTIPVTTFDGFRFPINRVVQSVVQPQTEAFSCRLYSTISRNLIVHLLDLQKKTRSTQRAAENYTTMTG